MKPKAFDTLTWAVVNGYGDRKKPGRLGVIVDVRTSSVYPVPRDSEHKDYICAILHTTPEAIYERPEQAAALIPVHIDLDPLDHRVVGVITGLSGFEEVYKVRHTKRDLVAAHQRALQFVANGEFQYREKFEDRIDPRYAVR